MRQLLFVNNRYYQFIRKIRKDQFKELSQVNEYKNILHSNHVLQDVDYYIFTVTVDDIEFEMIS